MDGTCTVNCHVERPEEWRLMQQLIPPTVCMRDTMAREASSLHRPNEAESCVVVVVVVGGGRLKLHMQI